LFLLGSRFAKHILVAMTKMIRNILLTLLGSAALATGYAASMPTIDVTVSDSGGKTVYSGKTGANGAFSTGNLPAGNYVVQFISAKVNGKYAINAAAGKNVMNSESVEGARFKDPGVAIRLKVDSSTKITGQVAPEGAVKQTAAAANQNVPKPTGPKKVMNGKTYYWVHPQRSSLEGGHWVEEGSPEALEAAGVKPPTNVRPTTSGGKGY
jgi:hypothetical protein